MQAPTTPHSIELLGDRHRQLVSMLATTRECLTVEQLADGLKITRTAVRQHLVSLERDGLVEMRGTQPSDGGRPRQLYTLTESARELLPRQYSWFAELLVEMLKDQVGSPRFKEQLRSLGERVGASLAGAAGGTGSASERATRLADAMAGVGYRARHITGARGGQTIEASNCVFHRLAEQHPEVCEFDLGLMGAFARATVTHQECMVRGGRVCRFKLTRPEDAGTPNASPPAS